MQKIAQSRRYDAIVALACVIRGATPHFDYVAGEASRGLAALSRELGQPNRSGGLLRVQFENLLKESFCLFVVI